jgi:predicted nucleotidyltransferase
MSPSEVVYLGQPPLRIDLLREIDGVPSDDLFAHAVAAEWSGIAIKVISLDDLIANKKAADRLQDRADVAVLEKMKARQKK